STANFAASTCQAGERKTRFAGTTLPTRGPLHQEIACAAVSQSASLVARLGGTTMKIFAQAGHQTGDKVSSGLQGEVLSGAIFSARNANPQKAVEQIAGATEAQKDAEVLFDPEFYAT